MPKEKGNFHLECNRQQNCHYTQFGVTFGCAVCVDRQNNKSLFVNVIKIQKPKLVTMHYDACSKFLSTPK